jgi:hypothetical protein
MSDGEISLGLTAAQVARVLREADADAGSAQPLSWLAHPREVMASPLLADRKVSRSLLFGLMVLICFPADGSERGVTEIARALRLPASTTYRYITTLLAVGLLARDPRTRRYRRAHPPRPRQGSLR